MPNLNSTDGLQEINEGWVPSVMLSECDGNAFSILGMVTRALRDKGASKEYCDQFYVEAMSGDYDHLIQTVMRYCEVE
jgi:hypothetical protein